jgi:hypothetical protein
MGVDVQGNDKLNMKLISLKCMLGQLYLFATRISPLKYTDKDTHMAIINNNIIINERTQTYLGKCNNPTISHFNIKLD